MALGKTLLVAVGLLCFSATAHARDNIVLQSGGGIYSIKTKTIKDQRFEDIIAQQRDFSCGSAALATLLKYHYNRPITEAQALQAMYEVGDKQKIEKEGFSLLDMKNYLASINIKSEGYRVSLDKLVQVGIPAIALINLKGYLHFVLVRGVDSENVLVADPALGAKTFSRSDFEKIWNKIFFVVLDDKATGKKHFNLAKHWGRKLSDHNLAQAISDTDLGVFTRHIAFTPGYF